MTILRPHDVAVALQLALEPGMTYPALSRALSLSVGETHNSVRRLIGARLVRRDDRAVNRGALLEFLTGGVPYVFAAEPGAETRGVPTAHSVAPMARELLVGDQPVVWPSANGPNRGFALEPLLPAAPDLAATSEKLYHLLAYVDAMRIGRARERQRARRFLEKELGAPPGSESET